MTQHRLFAVVEERRSSERMSSNQPSKIPAPPTPSTKLPNCKHPRVQIVSRDEDSEFVECIECGEIFESSEFKDMAIEERTPVEDA